MPEYTKNLRQKIFDSAITGFLFMLNLPDNRFTRGVMGRIFQATVGNVLDTALEFDRRLGADGIASGSKWLALKCGSPPEVTGEESIPAEGPVLIVSNHPGFFDSMVIIAQSPRDDLRVFVAGVPYYQNFPEMRKRTFYTDGTQADNVRALRDAVRYMKNGGCVLLYPTGQADPDPDVMDGTHEKTEKWSTSVSLIMRRVANALLVPTAISGIVTQRHMNHPIARIQRTPRNRQRAAELLQLITQFRKPDVPPLASPRVTFGKPVDAETLASEAGGREFTPAIIKRAQAVLADHMAFNPYPQKKSGSI